MFQWNFLFQFPVTPLICYTQLPLLEQVSLFWAPFVFDMIADIYGNTAGVIAATAAVGGLCGFYFLVKQFRKPLQQFLLSWLRRVVKTVPAFLTNQFAVPLTDTNVASATSEAGADSVTTATSEAGADSGGTKAVDKAAAHAGSEGLSNEAGNVEIDVHHGDGLAPSGAGLCDRSSTDFVTTNPLRYNNRVVVSGRV